MTITAEGSGYMHIPYSSEFNSTNCSCSTSGEALGGGGCSCNSPSLRITPLTPTGSSCTITGQVVLTPGHVIMTAVEMDVAEAPEARVLGIAVPRFATKMIVQKAPWPKATNVMRVTLSSNAALPKGARLTLAGLLDAVEIDTSRRLDDFYPDAPIFRETYGFLDGRTNPALKEITLTLNRRWVENTDAVLEFTIQNPVVIAPDSRPASVVTVEASIVDGTAAYLPSVVMDTSDEVYGGIRGARAPMAIFSQTYPACLAAEGNTFPRMRMDACLNETDAPNVGTCSAAGIVPVMDTPRMGQSTCTLGARNTLTVTLVSNVNLAVKCYAPCYPLATLTLLGLTGVKFNATTTTQTVTLKDVDTGAAGEEGIFGTSMTLNANGIGDLSLVNDRVMVAGKKYVFSFEVQNGL
ncbi:hypothetical protein T484DRAFT_1837487, partial [Baffinella frigidus]